MVLRLGRAPDGNGTQFTLVRVPDRLDDFFLDESEYASESRRHWDDTPDGEQTNSLDTAARDMLAAYRLLPGFSESTLVSLALATGVLSDALGLDVERIGTAPMTVASTFEFTYRPHDALSELVHHNGGQIEIDALALTQRNGERVLVVVEAKSGRQRALAKHKLFYPVLAALNVADDPVDRVIPVYLRATEAGDDLLYDVYECNPELTMEKVPCLANLNVVEHTRYQLTFGK